MAQRKAFRGLTPAVVEKRFLTADEPLPQGWHDTPAEALEAFQDAPWLVEAAPRDTGFKRGPGRPPKARP